MAMFLVIGHEYSVRESRPCGEGETQYELFEFGVQILRQEIYVEGRRPGAWGILERIWSLDVRYVPTMYTRRQYVERHEMQLERCA